MEPWVVLVLVACAVVLTVALVSLVVALRRVAIRSESVLGLVERDVRPLTAELSAVLTEVRELTQRANKDMARVTAIVQRAEDVSAQVARLVHAVSGLTRIGQVAGVLIGLKRGTDVFVKRLKQP